MTGINFSKVNLLSISAGKLIMEYYKKEDIEVVMKEDNSPVTLADLKASEFIIEGLKKITPGIRIVSEEEPYEKNMEIIQNEKLFWLIDPIDGTWSFIKKNGIFTVNIALIADGVPIYGDVYSPLEGINYYSNPMGIAIKKGDGDILAQHIQSNKKFDGGYDFLVSHQNLNQNIQDFINRYTIKTITPIPSSIKFPLIASGSGDIYPRFKKTCIWDTAAGHAILRAAGGEVYDLNGNILKYNKCIDNPSFVAVASKGIEIKLSD